MSKWTASSVDVYPNEQPEKLHGITTCMKGGLLFHETSKCPSSSKLCYGCRMFDHITAKCSLSKYSIYTDNLVLLNKLSLTQDDFFVVTSFLISSGVSHNATPTLYFILNYYEYDSSVSISTSTDNSSSSEGYRSMVLLIDFQNKQYILELINVQYISNLSDNFIGVSLFTKQFNRTVIPNTSSSTIISRRLKSKIAFLNVPILFINCKPKSCKETTSLLIKLSYNDCF